MSHPVHKQHEDAVKVANNIRNDAIKNAEELADDAPEGRVPDFDGAVASSYINKRRNATRRGLEFSLTLKDLTRLLKSKKCYYTGAPLRWDATSIEEKITLDRIDATVGYVPGNVVACSMRFNQLKAFIEMGHGGDQAKLADLYKGVAAGIAKTLKAF